MEKKLPFYIEKLLSDNNIKLDNSFYFAKGDLSDKGEFEINYLIFDKINVIVISGKEELGKSKHAKRIDVLFTPTKINTFKVSDISELKVDVFLSSARIYAVVNDEPTQICTFSLGVHKEFLKLCSIFSLLNEAKFDEIKDLLKQDDFDIYCPKCGKLYSEPERKICPHCMDKTSVAKRLLGFFKYYKKKVAFVVFLMMLTTGFSILSPFVSNKLLFDEVLTEGGKMYGQIGLIVLAILAVNLIGRLINIIFSYTLAGVMPSIVYDIKLKIFIAMQRLSVGFYTSKQTGSLMSRVQDDANNIYWFFIDGMPYIITSLITFIGVLVIMFCMNVTLALVTVIIVPGIVISFIIMSKIFRPLYHRNFVFFSNMKSFLSDTIGGQRIVRSFSKETTENERFQKINDEVTANAIKAGISEQTFFPIIYLVMFLMQMIVTFMGAMMIIDNKLELGTLLTFIMYIGMLYGPLEFLSWVSSWWTKCLDSSQRMFEIMDATPEVEEAENPINKETMTGNIELQNVFFEYEVARPIIKDVSIKVNAGEMIGIVGQAGAGKSTIVNLITRLFEVKSGAILIDDINIKDYKISFLRKNVGIVSQEIFLFSGTIVDNIRYAKPSATIEEVIFAAKSALAHDFISKLPDSYQTKIGAGAQELSGGEKQRLSIARTILQNPKILILDEATASMDTATERGIQESIDNLKTGRTTLAIAHRLSTLRDANKIAVIDNGKLIEYGTHNELIKKKGKFYELYTVQAKALKNISVGG